MLQMGVNALVLSFAFMMHVEWQLPNQASNCKDDLVPLWIAIIKLIIMLSKKIISVGILIMINGIRHRWWFLSFHVWNTALSVMSERGHLNFILQFYKLYISQFVVSANGFAVGAWKLLHLTIRVLYYSF